MPSSTVRPRAAHSAPSVRSVRAKIALWTLFGVIVLDQGAKWWAWRHVGDVKINLGGNALVGKTVGRWIADPLGGEVFDVLGATVFAAGFVLLIKRRMPTSVVILGALMLSGWSSNLLDRLGLHRATAPGSGRGAVDFMHIGRHFYNLADLIIIASTASLVMALGVELLHRLVASNVAAVDPDPAGRPSLVSTAGPAD